MGEQNTGEVTRLLEAAADADRAAIGRIYAILYPGLKYPELKYPELKAMAHRRVRHEAWQAPRSIRPPWCTSRTCGWSRPTSSIWKAGATSWPMPPTSCAARWSTSCVKRAPGGAAAISCR